MRMVDRNGMRGGAAISAIFLVLAWILLYDTTAGAIVVACVSVSLGIGSLFGPKRSPLGVTYRALKSVAKLGIPVELEPESPPRFAQTLGFVFTGIATVLLFTDALAVGWFFAILVAALQGLLAVTGICIGCEMYLIGKRLSARGA